MTTVSDLRAIESFADHTQHIGLLNAVYGKEN